MVIKGDLRSSVFVAKRTLGFLVTFYVSSVILQGGSLWDVILLVLVPGINSNIL